MQVIYMYNDGELVRGDLQVPGRRDRVHIDGEEYFVTFIERHMDTKVKDGRGEVAQVVYVNLEKVSL